MKKLIKKSLFFVLIVICLMAFAGSASAKTRVSLNIKNDTLMVGEKTALHLYGAKTRKIKWSSSNKNIATVNKRGEVLAKNVGKVTITAKYKKKKYRAAITVVDGNNEFYNLNNYCMLDNTVNIMPYHIYYKDNNLYAECYVINGFNHTVYNINVTNLSFYNASGKIADAFFGIIGNGGYIAARSYATYTFIFSPGYYIKDATLNTMIECKFNCINEY